MGKAVRERKNQDSCLLIVETEAAAGCEGSGECGVHLHCFDMGSVNTIQAYILTRLQTVGKRPLWRYYRPVLNVHEKPLRHNFIGDADGIFYGKSGGILISNATKLSK